MIHRLIILTLLLSGCISLQTPRSITYQAPSLLHNTQYTKWFESLVQIDSPWSRGTGFIVGVDTQWVYIMTAKHLIELSMRVDNQPAIIVALAAEHDLAVIKTANRRMNCRVYEFAQPTLDMEIWAIGYSTWYGNQIRLVHRGRVVSLDLTNLDGNWVVTHNAGGRGGMSGGPLLDKIGKVVGICSFFADTGLGDSINVSELCAVPGSSAAVFWKIVQTEILMEQSNGEW